MKKKSKEKKAYPKRETRLKTGWEHHEDMVINLRNWCRRQREYLERDLALDAEAQRRVVQAAQEIERGLDSWSSIVDERLKTKKV